jgi:AcrR family transcriptional regulator
LQDIADEAGANKALLHYYFRSKEKLYREIIKGILDHVIPRFSAALDSEGTLFERIEVVVNTYIDVLVEQPDIPFFIMAEISQEQESFMAELERRARFYPAIRSFLLEIMAAEDRGEIRPIAPVHLLLNLMGMCVFPFIVKPIFSNVLDLPEADYNELMNERRTVVVDFMRRALQPD